LLIFEGTQHQSGDTVNEFAFSEDGRIFKGNVYRKKSYEKFDHFKLELKIDEFRKSAFLDRLKLNLGKLKRGKRTKKAIKQKLDDFGYWVDDRVRTGDIWNHNPVL
jgi:hypothetical protein